VVLKKFTWYIVFLVLINGFILGSDQDFFEAIEKGEIKTVRSLIEKQPGLVNAKIPGWETPLHISIFLEKRGISELLLKKGAKVNAANDYGMTPLHFAFIRRNLDLAGLLLKNGADINRRDVWGRTPVYRAAWTGHIEGVQFLVQRGADINLQDEYGSSPLHAAVSGGDRGIIDLLLKHRAGIHSSDKWNRTPLFIAVAAKAADVINLLTAKGADLHHKNGWKQTVLHRAVIAGYPGIAEQLIDKGARINDKDSQNKTPLDYAGKYGHEKLAGLLETKGAKALSQITNFGYFPFDKLELENKEAVIWYLGHCGWAIKTKKHLLIFDYYEETPKPAEPKLVNGRVNPDEIRNQKVIVFTSHEHSDHFDKSILDWKNNLPDIHYVFGWKALEDPAHTYMGYRKKIKPDTFTIESIHSPEAGELEGNFLVTVDGLTIYHSGDYSRGHETFKKDMDYLARVAPQIDIFFMLAGNQMDNREALITLEKVKPRTMFPMHAGGSEYVFTAFAKSALEKGIKTKIVCSKNRGDMFLYKNSQIQPLDSYKEILKN
jgi:ankyrin repeat protein